MMYGGSLRPFAFTAYTWRWYSRPGSSGGILNWGTFSWILTNGANVAYARRFVSLIGRKRGTQEYRSRGEGRKKSEKKHKDINQYIITRSCQTNDKLHGKSMMHEGNVKPLGQLLCVQRLANEENYVCHVNNVAFTRANIPFAKSRSHARAKGSYLVVHCWYFII